MADFSTCLDHLSLNELRVRFSAEQVLLAISNTDSNRFHLFVPFHIWHRGETLRYWQWIFDECKVSFNTCVYGTGNHMYALECVYVLDYSVRANYPIDLVDFLLKRKASTRVGFDRLLYLARGNISLGKRLLDAGATPSDKNLEKDHALVTYYRSRLDCRAAILAFLAIRRRRGDIRQCVARDIWREMAQMVWEKRWDFFVGTRAERRYKIKE